MFDISNFSQQTVTAKLDTAIDPYPEGTYTFQIETSEDALKWRHGTTKVEEGKPARPWVAVDLKCRLVRADDVNLQQVATERGRDIDKMYFTYGLMLDLTDQGALDCGPGRNTKLGALRDAVGQNDASQAWHYDMLKGQVFKGKLVIKVDANDASRKFNNIGGIAAAQV